MPLILNLRFAILMLVVLPLAGGAVVHPQGAQAFVLGAWTGWLLVAPAAFVVMWVLGLRSAGQLLRPLLRVPVLLALAALVLHLGGASGPAGLVGAGGLWWWLRRGRGVI